MANREQIIKAVRDKIGVVPDFPKPGILFRDILPLFKDPVLLNDVILLLVKHIKERHEKVDVVVGLESKGFLFGPMIAQHLNAAFVPIRKKGKLPGECVKVEYTLGYGNDVFEAQKNAVRPEEKVIIVDDVIATGGSMDAACQLVAGMGGDILECLVVADRTGAAKLKKPVFALVPFEGE
ncbi:adenine phosphoribosyltransferase-like [Amphiura filiformis]|uniref:adenine phosphoribosyltransferase-like n=1 Tax=Amphiura filiformis TaxID=82378 RepID=UPI003B218622